MSGSGAFLRASFQQDEAVDFDIFHGAADDAGVEAVVPGESHHVDAAGFRRKSLKNIS